MTEKLSPSMPSDSLKSECLKSDRLIVSICSNLESQISNLKHPPFGTAYHLSARSSVGRQKESALMGRLGALLRPTWRSYAGPPQWHNKTPRHFERSGVEKSPRTMALAVSRGYVSRRNASLTSDRLTSSLSLSLLPQISYLKSQISFLPLPQL